MGVPTRAYSPFSSPIGIKSGLFEMTNKRLYSINSMLPKVIAEQRDHCYLPILGYQKTAKLQLPPPNSLLPYNSYYIIYIQFPVRSGFVVGQINTNNEKVYSNTAAALISRTNERTEA